ncbi:hypothetical protein AB733_22945 [Photobacterium swingsii]|uniref:Uncharacterized protein n=1 Tax=Photobacterium swingsii TaxID=680026 RepID=A0A0J8V787_9GAMM|nr:hypothetical protein [Photobacterium swingsii]KMV28540.1 hypothetical protein AB733_22945 [Photobacterium swingsii]PSW24506.1 hypothetical protein C9I94_10745 [Photobacterium swingsii]
MSGEMFFNDKNVNNKAKEAWYNDNGHQRKAKEIWYNNNGSLVKVFSGLEFIWYKRARYGWGSVKGDIGFLDRKVYIMFKGLKQGFKHHIQIGSDGNPDHEKPINIDGIFSLDLDKKAYVLIKKGKYSDDLGDTIQAKLWVGHDDVSKAKIITYEKTASIPKGFNMNGGHLYVADAKDSSLFRSSFAVNRTYVNWQIGRVKNI